MASRFAAGEQESWAAALRLLKRGGQLQRLQLSVSGPRGSRRLSSALSTSFLALQHLQDLQLTLGAGAYVGCFEALPSSLTRLHLTDHRVKPSLGTKDGSSPPTLPPSLTHLSRLSVLHLSSCALQPSVLGTLPALTHLELSECVFLPYNSQKPDVQTSEGLSAFLSTLASSVTQLQHLALSNMALELQEPVPLQQFAALTAPPQLTALHLTAPYGDKRVLPAGAVPYAFGAGRRLQHLRQLTITTTWSMFRCCMHGQDLGLIFSACPALESLSVAYMLYDGADLSSLLQLPPSCSSLSVGGHAWDDTAAAYISQHTQLTSLTWRDSPELTDDGFTQLKALVELRELTVEGCCLSQVYGGAYDYPDFDDYDEVEFDQVLELVSSAAEVRLCCAMLIVESLRTAVGKLWADDVLLCPTTHHPPTQPHNADVSFHCCRCCCRHKFTCHAAFAAMPQGSVMDQLDKLEWDHTFNRRRSGSRHRW